MSATLHRPPRSPRTSTASAQCSFARPKCRRRRTRPPASSAICMASWQRWQAQPCRSCDCAPRGGPDARAFARAYTHAPGLLHASPQSVHGHHGYRHARHMTTCALSHRISPSRAFTRHSHTVERQAVGLQLWKLHFLQQERATEAARLRQLQAREARQAQPAPASPASAIYISSQLGFSPERIPLQRPALLHAESGAREDQLAGAGAGADGLDSSLESAAAARSNRKERRWEGIAAAGRGDQGATEGAMPTDAEAAVEAGVGATRGATLQSTAGVKQRGWHRRAYSEEMAVTFASSRSSSMDSTRAGTTRWYGCEDQENQRGGGHRRRPSTPRDMKQNITGQGGGHTRSLSQGSGGSGRGATGRGGRASGDRKRSQESVYNKGQRGRGDSKHRRKISVPNISNFLSPIHSVVMYACMHACVCVCVYVCMCVCVCVCV